MAESGIRVRHPLLELTRARLLEFVRDPGAIFWVFVFPVLLAIALGVAFRDQGSAAPALGPPGAGAAAHGSGRYIEFLVPGLIGLNIMGSCLWGLGYAVVDARRRKLLKRFAVTPMNRTHFLLAFMLSRLVFLVLEVGVLVAFGWLVFDVEVRGSLLALGALALAGTAAFSGLALLIAARTESTEVASGWMNFVQLPMWLLSGSFFAYTRFPEFLHPAIRALPLTAINDALREVINGGAGLWEVAPELLLLVAWGVVGFALALRTFRWH